MNGPITYVTLFSNDPSAQLLLTSTTKEFRNKHLNYVLEYYLKELKAVIQKTSGEELK